MSSDPESEDEQLEVDDGTLSEVIRRPTRTAGDLSEAADASAGITTEDLARDLEAVASKRGVPTESELLADLLRRVQRIEEHLRVMQPPSDMPSEPCLPGASSGHDRRVAVLGRAARRAVDRAGHNRVVGLRIFDR